MLTEIDRLALKTTICCLEETLLKHKNLEILKEKHGEIYTQQTGTIGSCRYINIKL